MLDFHGRPFTLAPLPKCRTKSFRRNTSRSFGLRGASSISRSNRATWNFSLRPRVRAMMRRIWFSHAAKRLS